MSVLHLSAIGFTDVALTATGGVVVWRQGDPRYPGAVVVSTWKGTDVEHLTEIFRLDLPSGSPCFPKVDVPDSTIWVFYHDGEAGFLRNMTTRVTERLDPCENNDPACFGNGYFAWQGSVRQGWPIYRMTLATGEITMVGHGAGTGLSRILTDGSVRLVDQDRFQLAGATRPSWAGDLVVGEGPDVGLLYQRGWLERGTLWPQTVLFVPHADALGARYAVVAAGPVEGRLFCGTSVELAALATPPPLPPPPVLEPPAVTFLSFPTSAQVGDPATCVVDIRGGLADRLIWLYRLAGESTWRVAAAVSPPKPTQDFHFPTAGDWEIAARIEGPGGADQTATRRVIHVKGDAPDRVFAFTHPVLIVPFKDPDKTAGTTYRMEDGSLGVYTEAPDPSAAVKAAAATKTRVLIAHDAPTIWEPPAGLRAWDIPFVELYRLPTESMALTQARWRGMVQTLIRSWPHDCGVIPQFYCQGGAPPSELWTVAEVLEGLQCLSELVNLSPRIKVIAPFAYARANGISAHVELQHAFRSLKIAAHSGVVLTPIDPPPTPPLPTTPFPAATVLKGSPMKAYLALKGKYLGVSPTVVSGKTGDDAYPVYADRATHGPWEEVEILQQGSAFFVRFTTANRVLSLSPDGVLQTRPAGTSGPWESFFATTQPDQINFLYRKTDATHALIEPVVTIVEG